MGRLAIDYQPPIFMTPLCVLTLIVERSGSTNNKWGNSRASTGARARARARAGTGTGTGTGYAALRSYTSNAREGAMSSTSATGSAGQLCRNAKFLHIIRLLLSNLPSKDPTIVGLVVRLDGVRLSRGVCKRSACLLLAHRLRRGAVCAGPGSTYDTRGSIRIWIILGHLPATRKHYYGLHAAAEIKQESNPPCQERSRIHRLERAAHR